MNKVFPAITARSKYRRDFPVNPSVPSHEQMTHELISDVLAKAAGNDAKPSNKRVLLIDNNAATAGIMEAFFHRKGCTVKKARDGKTAICEALEFDPEIILLDLGLPDMNGFELLKELKKLLGQRHYVVHLDWGNQNDTCPSTDYSDDREAAPINFKFLEDVLFKLI